MFNQKYERQPTYYVCGVCVFVAYIFVYSKHSFNLFSLSSLYMYALFRMLLFHQPLYHIVSAFIVCWCMLSGCLLLFPSSFSFAFLDCVVSCWLDGAEEPLAANGNHLGFEIHQNSGYSRNNNNRNNGFYAAAPATDVESSYSNSNSNSNIETSDYFDDKYYETRKHR